MAPAWRGARRCAGAPSPPLPGRPAGLPAAGRGLLPAGGRRPPAAAGKGEGRKRRGPGVLFGGPRRQSSAEQALSAGGHDLLVGGWGSGLLY